MALHGITGWLLPSPAPSLARHQPGLSSCRCAGGQPWLANAAVKGRERGCFAVLQFRNISVFTRGYDVSEPGAVSSGLIDSMALKIKQQLSTEDVVIKDASGDGRHVSIDVVAAAFEGQSRVGRQRMVYKAIWEELQGAVHAVDQLTTKTPDEAAKETTS